MTVDTVVDAEIVDSMAKAAAERLDKRIRLLVGSIHESLAKLHGLVEEAKQGDVHKVLGYPSWTAYLADVFTVRVRLEVEQRRELVAYLSGEGMSQRLIADVVGTGVGTVNRDLAESPVPDGTPEPVTGRDGKTYPRKPKPVVDKPEAGQPGDRTDEHQEPEGDEPDEEDARTPLEVLALWIRMAIFFSIKSYPDFASGDLTPQDVQYRAEILDCMDGIRDLLELSDSGIGRAVVA